MFRLGLALVVAWAAAGAWTTPPARTTFKVATWNVRSGMGVAGFRTGGWRDDTLNCADRGKPLNAWGVGLPQRELQRIAADPTVVALAVQEAWNCGSPDRLNSVLRFKAATREHNGVALLARYGFSRPDSAERVVAGAGDNWVVGAMVCLDSHCGGTLPMFSTHWSAKHDAEWPLLAASVMRMLQSHREPHVLTGDLNVFRIDRWNPKVPCTRPDSTGRSAAIDTIERAGYVDAWKATQGGAGWTGMANRRDCGSRPGGLYKRIDYIYAKELNVVSTTLFGRSDPGTDASSDHVGLVAELSLKQDR